MRIGQGIDIHRFSEDPHRPLVLGGVVIEGARGLGGHSDADAVCHSLADAVLGAVGLGDLGRHFPDTDPVWEGADSVALLTAGGADGRCPGVRLRQRRLHDHRRHAPSRAAHRGHGRTAERRCSARRCRSRRRGPRAWGPWGGPRASPAWPSSSWSPGEPQAVPARPPPPRPPPAPPPARGGRGTGGGTCRGPAGAPRQALPSASSAVTRSRVAGGARAALGRSPPVRRVVLAEGQDPSPQLDRIEELAARLRVPVETVPRSRLDAQARTEAPQGVLALARPLEPVPLEELCRPDATVPRPSSWWRPASPIPATWACSCAAWSARASPASCCRAIARPGCRPRSPRRRRGRSSTCASRWSVACPPPWASCATLGVWSIGLAGEADAVALPAPARRRPRRLRPGERGEGACAAGAPALRRGRRHPPARCAALAQRGRGRCGGLLRGGRQRAVAGAGRSWFRRAPGLGSSLGVRSSPRQESNPRHLHYK